MQLNHSISVRTLLKTMQPLKHCKNDLLERKSTVFSWESAVNQLVSHHWRFHKKNQARPSQLLRNLQEPLVSSCAILLRIFYEYEAYLNHLPSDANVNNSKFCKPLVKMRKVPELSMIHEAIFTPPKHERANSGRNSTNAKMRLKVCPNVFNQFQYYGLLYDTYVMYLTKVVS